MAKSKCVEENGVMKKKKVQKNLFGELVDDVSGSDMKPIDDRPVLLLNNIADTKPFKAMMAFLNANYTKVELETFATHLKKTIKKFNVRDKAHPEKEIEAFTHMYMTVRTKMDIMDSLALVFADDENFTKFFDEQTYDIKDVWRMVYLYRYADGKMLNRMSGKTIVQEDKSRGYYHYSRYNSFSFADDGCCFFSLSGYYNYPFKGSGAYVYMKDEWRELYERCIFHRDYPLEDTDEPLLDGFVLYSNEEAIGSQVALIKQMNEQGMLEFGATKMAQATIKKASQQLGVKEFYPDTKDKELKLLAASYMIPAITDNLGRKDENVMEYWKVLKDIFNGFDHDMIVMEFLSHLRTVRRDGILWESAVGDVYSNIITTLEHLSPDRWYSVEDFDTRRRHEKDFIVKCITLVKDSFIYNGKTTHASNGERLRVGEAKECFGDPVMKGFLLMFAACGLLEVALDDEEKVEHQIIPDYLRCLKLTPLGAYVFGHTQSYKAKGVRPSTDYFEMDQERLLIRSVLIDGKNPYEPLLSRIAEPIGSHRFRVTPQTYMKDCEGITDIIGKWDFIKNSICETPSEVWSQFHDMMVKRCHPLSNAGIGYTVKKISPNDRELLQILSTDKYIREHTMKAEHYHLLIETKCLEKVKERLRGYGYLV